MKMIVFVALNIFLIFGTCSKLMAQADYLELVEEKTFFGSLYKPEYYYSIRSVLFDGLSVKPQIRYINFFQMGYPVYVLDIEYDSNETKYFLILHTFSHRKPVPAINRHTEKIELHIYKKEISKESVDLIKELFQTAIKKAKPHNNRTGLDGTDYYFFINQNDKLHGGTVWSPDKKSKMGKLVKIGDQLMGLTRSKKEIVAFDVNLTKRIIDLINEINSI